MFGAGDVDRADDDAEGAVGLQAADRAGRLERRRTGRRWRRRRPRSGAGSRSFQVGMVAQALQALAQPDPRPGAAVGHRVALVGGVLEAQLDRVDAELAGERRPWSTRRRTSSGGRRAHGRRPAAMVLVTTVVAADAEVREAVEGAGVERGVGERAAVVEAGVDDEAGVEGGQGAVLPGADLQVDRHPRGGVGGLELVHAGVDDADGAVELDRPGRRRAAGSGCPCRRSRRQASGAVDLDAVLGQAERAGDLLAGQEDALGGGPDGQVAERVHERRWWCAARGSSGGRSAVW